MSGEVSIGKRCDSMGYNEMSGINRDNRFEVRLSGSGGQGLILAGIILAEAAGIYDGKYVTQTQNYGPEARGGVSRSDVIMSSEEIDFPEAIKLDMLVAMNQKSCDAYFPDLKPDGILLVDSTFVSEVPTERAVAIPFSRVAREKTGKDFVANIIFLGALTEFCPVVSAKAMESAVLARVPKGTEKLNCDALQAGIDAARRFKEEAAAKKIPVKELSAEED